jgi:hypothetical protein
MTSRKKPLPPDLQKSGIFSEFDAKRLADYISQFKRPGEADFRFLERVRSKKDHGWLAEVRAGRQPHIDDLKEIWWNLRFDGCQFSVLMRLAFGISAREPELSEYWRRKQNH